MRLVGLTGRPKGRCVSVSFRAAHQGNSVNKATRVHLIHCRQLSQVPGKYSRDGVGVDAGAGAGAGVAVDGPGRRLPVGFS